MLNAKVGWLFLTSVLVAGASGLSEPPASVWTIDLVNEAPPARMYSAMTALPNGNVLVFGGQGEDGRPLGDTWVLEWQGETLSWQELRPPHSPTPRYGHAMLGGPDGAVLIGGHGPAGKLYGDMWIFSRGDWRRVEPGLPSPRFNTMAWVEGESVYVLGGLRKKPGGKYFTPTADFWRFDFRTNAWTELPAPPVPVSSSGNVYIAGGHEVYLLDLMSPGDQGLVYHMDSGVWGYKTWSCKLPAGGWFGYQVAHADGKAFVVGGVRYDPATHSYTYTKEAWVFAGKTGACRRMEDLPRPVARGTSTWLPAEEGYVLWGGSGGNGVWNDPRRVIRGHRFLDRYSFP